MFLNVLDFIFCLFYLFYGHRIFWINLVQTQINFIDTVDCSDIFRDIPECLPPVKSMELEISSRELLNTYYLPYKDENGLVKGYNFIFFFFLYQANNFRLSFEYFCCIFANMEI